MTPGAFTRLWSPGRLLLLDSSDAGDPFLHRLLVHPQKALQRGENTRPGRQRSRKSRSVVRLDLSNDHVIYLKYFYPKNLWRYFLSLVMPSRAQNAFHIHRQLLGAGLPVPRPIASLDCRQGLYYESYLVIQEIPHTQPIRDFVLENIETLQRDSRFRSRLFTEVGRLIRRFHDLRFFHVDLSIKNILISFDPLDSQAFSLSLIDFDTCYSLAYLPHPLFAPFGWTDLRRLIDSIRYGLPAESKRNVLDAYFAGRKNAHREEARFLIFYRRTHRPDDPVYQPVPPRAS